ncbi:hypothetical protein PMI21_05073, partial [Pseudomonas sp. GM18]
PNAGFASCYKECLTTSQVFASKLSSL